MPISVTAAKLDATHYSIPSSCNRTLQTFLSLVIFKTTALYALLSLFITDYQTCNIVSRSPSNESYVGLDHLQEAKISRFTYPQIAVLLTGTFRALFFRLKPKRPFSHTKIYIANKAQYIYIYIPWIKYLISALVGKKKRSRKNPQSITAVLHLNFFHKSFFLYAIETAVPKISDDDTVAQ